jgi:hypothetical protein
MSDRQNPWMSNSGTNVYLPEDDVDMLFAHLQQVEPPPSLIARILEQTSQHTSTTPIDAQPLQQFEIDAG